MKHGKHNGRVIQRTSHDKAITKPILKGKEVARSHAARSMKKEN